MEKNLENNLNYSIDDLIVSATPHLRDKSSVSGTMLDVVIAMVPAIIASVYFYGIRAFNLILVSVLVAVATEMGIQKILKKPYTVKDLSAVITGILLAFNVPPRIPFYMVIIGSFLSIAVIKQLYGGLGYNFMNPALAGRAMMLASWPSEMGTQFFNTDMVASATPLADISNYSAGIINELPFTYSELFWGNIPGVIGEISKFAIIIGGVYLIFRKVISWRIPVIYIATTAITLFFVGDRSMIIYHVLAGGLMLGAFFMATDYSTSPISKNGQIIYAIGCGLLTALIRVFGGYPEGVSLAILLMNVATPLIERLTIPKVFGGVKKK